LTVTLIEWSSAGSQIAKYKTHTLAGAMVRRDEGKQQYEIWDATAFIIGTLKNETRNDG